MSGFTLEDFVRESNRIEGIHREPHPAEIAAHETILASVIVTVLLLKQFVSVVQPGAILRDRENLNVRVGRHVAPQGGSEVVARLTSLLITATRAPRISNPFAADEAYHTHQAYEHLHPFTDGNGRSGRAVWLWIMGGIERAPLGFLHHWYYQSLNESR